MRKLFSIFGMVLVSLALHAAQVTQNVWGGSLALTNAEFQPHNETMFAAGQTLRLTFVNNSGWMQVFHKDGANEWSSTDLVNGLDLSAGSVEVVLSSTAASEIQSYGGLYIKGENITLKSIDLIYDNGVAPEMTPTTIWTGTLTSEVNQMSEETNIDASHFGNAQVGNKIRFYFSNNDGTSYYQMSAQIKNSSWNTAHQYLNYSGVEAPYTEITLVEEGLEDLKERGLYFQGLNITITKAELLQPTWVAASSWTGTILTETETNINANYFASAIVGNKIRVYFSNNADQSYYQMSAKTKTSNWETGYEYMSYVAVEAPYKDIVIVEESLEDLKERGLYIMGKNITINKVELLREKVSSDDLAAIIADTNDPTILLSELNGETIDFTLNRTFYCDGYYNTLCLPFSLVSMEGTPLADATVMEFVGSEITGTKEGDDLVLNVTIDEVSSIEAGKPYLISFPSGSDITSMTFHNVTISAISPQTVNTTLLKMVGIFAPEDLAANNDDQLFLGADNTLYWSNGTEPLKGYRAYFEINSGSLPKGMPARIVNRHNTTTDIESAKNEQKVEKVLRNGQLFIIRDGKQFNVLGAVVK
jgi:hypothetical protein